MRSGLQEEGRQKEVRDHCWCGEDLERNRHSVHRNCCRICGNIEARHHAYVQREQEKRARKLAGLPPMEEGPPPLSAMEIKQAITGQRINR